MCSAGSSLRGLPSNAFGLWGVPRPKRGLKTSKFMVLGCNMALEVMVHGRLCQPLGTYFIMSTQSRSLPQSSAQQTSAQQQMPLWPGGASASFCCGMGCVMTALILDCLREAA
eukprot:364634-Chlamydomonas_euryale.AAC.4